MRKNINIKSVILENGLEIDVEQLANKEDGIKFYVTKPIHDNFDILSGLHKTVSLEKIKVRTLKNKIYTLFNCFYTVRGADDLYIHLLFNEIVRCEVEERNFKCNELIVEFENTNNLKCKDFSENINFSIDDIMIKHFINKNKYEVIISSNDQKERDVLFSYFSDYFEIINMIIGYFPTIIKTTYKSKTISYVVENEIVSKYVTSNEYIKRDLGFLKNIDNTTLKDAYIKYRKFSSEALLQMSMYFMSTMKRNSYVEINVVNILQTLDGLYDKLSKFKNEKEHYSVEMNNDIINTIKNIDFSDINKKYNNDTNINNKIVGCISRMNYLQYRNKLKNMFKYSDYLVFKEEKKNNNSPFIKYNTLINKCVNSRNKFSHIIDNEDYLFETENVVYIHKFVLIFRLLILEEIGLSASINMQLLHAHILLINNYIKSVLSKKD